MCFVELIGYTCGHSSAEVLRPCPMTTRFDTNPVCTSRARRPIQAPEMCPACQRIIHGRAVLTTEWEHHWMHERGVCGCDVVFPDLIRPRVVSRAHPSGGQITSSDSDSTEGKQTPFSSSSSRGKNKSSKKGKNKGKRNGKKKHVLSQGEGGQKNGQAKMVSGGAAKEAEAAPRNTSGTSSRDGKSIGNTTDGSSTPQKPSKEGSEKGSSIKTPPMSQDPRNTSQKTSGRNNKTNKAAPRGASNAHNQGPASTIHGDAGNTPKQPAGVSIQIPSLHGVEWVEGHRQLHNAGSCRCPADFSFYQAREAHGSASIPLGNAGEQAPYQTEPYCPGIQGCEQAPGPTYLSSAVFASDPRLSGMNYFHNSFTNPGAQGPYGPNEVHGLGAWGQHMMGYQQPQEYHQAWYQGPQPGNPYQYAGEQVQGFGQGYMINIGQQTSNSGHAAPMWDFSQGLEASWQSTGVGRPVRSAGAIWPVDPSRSTNPIYNYACVEGAKGASVVDIQPIDYPKPAGAPQPLVGLPIGAGPEGAPRLSHAGPFEDCVLRRRGAGVVGGGAASPGAVAKLLEKEDDGDDGDTRVKRLGRLLRGSASVACLAHLRGLERGRRPEAERSGYYSDNDANEADGDEGDLWSAEATINGGQEATH